MTRLLRCGWLCGGLMFGVACGTERPTAPSAVTASPTSTQPTPSPSPPPQVLPLGDPVATYVTPGSQFLLYDGGVFALRYAAFAYVYQGTYRHDDDTITFRFDAAWTWDQGWRCLSDSRPTHGLCPFATGTRKGELLEVRFGDSMQHSDFYNAVYRQAQ